MKVRSLFYLITVCCIAFVGCKKEGVTPNNIVGQWYVERYTVYNSSVYSSTYDANTPVENYESVGLFNFNDNGTGTYTFENLVVPFTYIISGSSNNSSGSSSSFNGISIGAGNDNDNVIDLTFDKSSITSLRSPILAQYYTNGLERYQVFSRTKGTLQFKGELYSGYSSVYSNNDKIEFVLTKQ